MLSSLNHLKLPEVGISFHSFMAAHGISSTWNVISFLLNLANSHSSVKTQCTNLKNKRNSVQASSPPGNIFWCLPFWCGIAVPSVYIPLPFHFLSPPAIVGLPSCLLHYRLLAALKKFMALHATLCAQNLSQCLTQYVLTVKWLNVCKNVSRQIFLTAKNKTPK